MSKPTSYTLSRLTPAGGILAYAEFTPRGQTVTVTTFDGLTTRRTVETHSIEAARSLYRDLVRKGYTK